MAATNRASVKLNKQNNKQTMTTTVKTLMMRLKLQRPAAAAAVVAARGPSPQDNQRRMAKEKTATYMEEGNN